MGLIPSIACCFSGYCFLYGTIAPDLSFTHMCCAYLTSLTSVLCFNHTSCVTSFSICLCSDVNSVCVGALSFAIPFSAIVS